MDSFASDILFERRGAAGIATLNRPKALNAVTHAMVRALAAQLARWAEDPAITRVVVTAAGDRAFSAGGDIRALYDLGRAGRYVEALQFWRDEYALNVAIKRYRKPYVALIDGIVMGGGAGVAVHGSHRVAGDRMSFAMPEIGIGFFPDIGATWFLPRLPGLMGTYCALSGARLGPADAVTIGIATHRVRSDRFPDLLAALCGTVSVDATIAAFAEPAEGGPEWARRSDIDLLFAGASVEAIVAALDREAKSGGAAANWAGGVAQSIRGKSPTSLKIALAQMRFGAEQPFDACMHAEFRIVSRVIRSDDFYEGVRAVILDKDNAPRWQPAALEDVSEADVRRYFEPVDDELLLP